MVSGEADEKIPARSSALLSEPEIFSIYSSGYPKFLKAIIDPLDVHVGDIQTMTVEVEDPSGIDWVKAEIGHDAGTTEIELELIKGEWHGEWLVYNTHSKTYYTTFTAQNKKGEQNSITLAWTDPCAPPNGGDWTLDGNCAISGVDGVDDGNLTIVTYTLTIQNGGTFAWNSGKNITISSGSIAINSGGVLNKTNLWVNDSDEDTYYNISNEGQVAQDDSPGPGYVRRNTVTTADDCDDTCATCYPGSTSYTSTPDGLDQDCDGLVDEDESVADKTCTTASSTWNSWSGLASACTSYCGGSLSCGYTGTLNAAASFDWATCGSSGSAGTVFACRIDVPLYGADNWAKCDCPVVLR
jgi:hypothetical protein